MCESVPLLAASNRDGHHHEGKKTTEMNTDTGDLDVPPQPTPETPGSSALLSPSPALVYYPDEFRYRYDDDSHLQDQEDDGADQQLDEGDGADGHELLEDDAPPAEERAPTTGGWLAATAKVALFARQKVSEVNTAGAVVTGLGLVGTAVGVYFLWPAAAGVAAVGATMKAPGGAGLLISRAAFLANPQLYFQILRTAGAAAAAAAFAL